MTEKEYEALYEALEAAYKILEDDRDRDEQDADLCKKIRKLEKILRRRQKAVAKGKASKKEKKLTVGELNSQRKWTPQEIRELALLARARTPVDLIAVERRRTEKPV